MAGRKGMSHGLRNPLSEEVKQKIRETMKSKWQDKEYQKQMSKAHSHPISEEHKKNISNAMLGVKKSKETKKNMSIATGLRIKQGNNGGTPTEPTSIEIKMSLQLDKLGIKYVQQKYVCSKCRSFILDFYLPDYKLVIECNGDYWHSLSRRAFRDIELEEFVKSTGRFIIFVWEHDITKSDFDLLPMLRERELCA